MCILIHHPINTQFAVAQLQDFYNRNPDGFGAIVKHGDTVEVIKSVGKLEEIVDLYQSQVSGREAVIHFRMKTHGDINIDNCHPYEVMPGLYMAHNGILSTGNTKDPKMSDTWHYINDFLRPVLSENPDLLLNAGFQAMISSHIGANNKFGFMRSDGTTVIINKTSGVMHQGVWYSNTYAWTPWKFGLGNPPAPVSNRPFMSQEATQGRLWDSRYSSSSTWRAWDKMDREVAAQKPQKRSRKSRKASALPIDITRTDTHQLKKIIRDSYNAVNLDGVSSVIKWVERSPMAAMRFIYEIYGNERSKRCDARSISHMVNTDPYEAADWILDIWDSMEDDLCDLAEIKVQPAYPF